MKINIIVKSKNIVALSLILVATGCQSGNFLGSYLSRSFGLKSFDKTEMLDVMGENVILPLQKELHDKTSFLNEKIVSFTASPDAEKLREARKAWINTALTWKKNSVFNFGPVKEERVIPKIDFWPKRVDSIEEVIKSPVALPEGFMESVGAAKKGLPVIEYLLFAEENGAPLALNDLKSREYLKLASGDLLKNTGDYVQTWENYYNKAFVTEADSVNMLMNQIIVILEEIKDPKLGDPSGLRTGGEPHPEMVEAPESDNSLANILANLDGIKIAFNGITSDGRNLAGLDDYLDFLEKKDLSDSINAQLDKTKQAVSEIPEPLETSVISQKEKVKTAHDNVKELMRLVKVDLASAINETVSLSTNDGD